MGSTLTVHAVTAPNFWKYVRRSSEIDQITKKLQKSNKFAFHIKSTLVCKTRHKFAHYMWQKRDCNEIKVGLSFLSLSKNIFAYTCFPYYHRICWPASMSFVRPSQTEQLEYLENGWPRITEFYIRTPVNTDQLNSHTRYTLTTSGRKLSEKAVENAASDCFG